MFLPCSFSFEYYYINFSCKMSRENHSWYAELLLVFSGCLSSEVFMYYRPFQRQLIKSIFFISFYYYKSFSVSNFYENYVLPDVVKL